MESRVLSHYAESLECSICLLLQLISERPFVQKNEIHYLKNWIVYSSSLAVLLINIHAYDIPLYE